MDDRAHPPLLRVCRIPYGIDCAFIVKIDKAQVKFPRFAA